jgi:hypothetical protein
MSQKTIYTCDSCQKEIGEKPHISLSFSNYSGIALPPNTPNNTGGILGQWKVVNSIQGRFYHFCSGTCIGSFFTGLMKKSVVVKKK